MLKQFTIKRSEWLRGNQPIYVSCLLNPRARSAGVGYKCCLGFFCLDECKISEEKIIDMGIFEKDWPEIPERMRNDLHSNTSIAKASILDQIIQTNDNEDMQDSERELKLKELFAHYGYEPVFVD